MWATPLLVVCPWRLLWPPGMRLRCSWWVAACSSGEVGSPRNMMWVCCWLWLRHPCCCCVGVTGGLEHGLTAYGLPPTFWMSQAGRSRLLLLQESRRGLAGGGLCLVAMLVGHACLRFPLLSVHPDLPLVTIYGHVHHVIS